MFDKKEPKIIKKKSRLIEILLIVGGIIGSFALQQNNLIVKMLFVGFLISSIFYYTQISELPSMRFKRANKFAIFIAALGVSLMLPAVIIYPVILDSDIDKIIKYIFYLEYFILSVVIIVYLYFKD
jgi:hypothetical protein